MKRLIVYYSRTGTTRSVAQSIHSRLQCDCEELIDTKNRTGILGYLRSGRDVGAKAMTTLQTLQYKPENYDVVILGTPVWRNSMSTPIRTYTRAHFKYVAFFCIQKGNKHDAFKELRALCGQIPLASLSLREAEVKQNVYQEELDVFIDSILLVI